MKVLYVSHNPSFQGAVLSLYTLIRGLDRGGYTPLAAFAKHGQVVDRLRSEGVDARVLKKRGFLGTGLVREAYGLIKGEGVGIVHLNNAVPFCKYVAIAARLAGARVVWHVREDPKGKRIKKLGFWVRLLADRIIAVSTEIEDCFRGSGKALKIYNGVDTEEFTPDIDADEQRRRFGIDRNAFVFGMVGTVEPRKGVITFLRAAGKLLEDGADCSFLVVGSGLPEYEAEMREFIEGVPGLKERTVLTGRISEVPAAMAALDVLVMPSLWEGFPRVVIEAMASGRPVIATPVGEVPRVVEDGITGFITPVDDPDALAGTMKKCLEKGGGLKEMGRLAREKAVSLYNLRAHVENVQRVYGSLV